MIYKCWKHNMDGTKEYKGCTRSKTKAHDWAERMNEDWDDPTGAWYSYTEEQE